MLVSVLAAGLGLFTLARRQRATLGPAGPVDVLLAVAVATMVTVPFTVMAALNATTIFAAVHVAYFGVVVTVPLIGVGVLVVSVGTVARRGGTPRQATILCAALMVALAPVGLYMTYVEPVWLRIDRESIPLSGDRAGSGVVRVGVISDIQTATIGDYERRAVDTLMQQRPDVILVPGDVVHMDDERFEEQLPAVRELLGRLSAPGGVYLVPGDVDGAHRLARAVEGTEVRLLENEVVRVRVGDRELLIGGADGHGTPSPVLDELLVEPVDGAATILLAHRPDAVLDLPPASRVDLTVAGHTHGGQVVVPIFGPPLTLSRVPRDVARGGTHTMSDNLIYVSSGVGAERGGAPQIRLMSRPSIGVLELG